MQFVHALNYVEMYGISMLEAPGSNLQAIAVTGLDGGPITAAKDFAVTAYVIDKLST